MNENPYDSALQGISIAVRSYRHEKHLYTSVYVVTFIQLI